MSYAHFPFFINVAPLLLGALPTCVMLTKPYPFKTAQTPEANRDRWVPGFKAGLDQKLGGDNSGESR